MSTSVSEPAGLVSVLKATEIFGSLGDDELRGLAARFQVHSVDDGAVLASAGRVSRALWLPLDCVLSIARPQADGTLREIGTVRPGDTACESHLFSPLPSTTSVTAAGSGTVAAMSAEAFEGFFDTCPAGALHALEAMRPRLRRQGLSAALYRSQMFGSADPQAVSELEDRFELTSLYGGEELFRQGDRGESLYVVISGRLRVVRTAEDGTDHVLAELGAGETVGEMAVLSGEPRSATVYAIRDTQVARLTGTAVRGVLERHPHEMLQILTTPLVERVRTMSRGTRARADVVTIAVIPAGPRAPLAGFAAQLAAALARTGAAIHLTSTVVDRHLGRSGAAQAHDRDGGSTGLVEWLAHHESAHRFVLYEADPGLTPWTERCVRQADRIVLVAAGGDDPSASDVETELLVQGPGRRTPVTLALVHADGRAVPTGTARWLRGRRLERHLHIRSDTPADHERLARFVTGTALGIALGGGFARGLAHLGVLRALSERGIAVDAIGGASMGAMVGAQWVCGASAAGISEAMRTGFAESFDDMTLPFLSFKRGGKASGFIRRLFGNVRIEDLWLPYFCVSANLNRAELKVHTTGCLADAVLSSSRAPGIFPPMVIEGELHVDGGLINNVPVDVMKSFVGDGLVLGVDVSPPHELNHVQDYGTDVPGWRAAWMRFNPARDKRVYHPSILLVLMRVIEFGGISYRREKAEMADIYIAPPVLRFKRNDFALADEIAACGYEAARMRLDEWLASASAAVRTKRPDIFKTNRPPSLRG